MLRFIDVVHQSSSINMAPKPCPSTKNQTLVTKAAVPSAATSSAAAIPSPTSLPLTLEGPEQKTEAAQLSRNFKYGYNRLLAIKNTILNKPNSKMLWDLYGQMATSLASCMCFLFGLCINNFFFRASWRTSFIKWGNTLPLDGTSCCMSLCLIGPRSWMAQIDLRHWTSINLPLLDLVLP